MKNPRYANEQGGILVEQNNGRDLYIDSGDLYQSILSGDYGPISEYTAPPQPSVSVPPVVSRFQARAALYQAGVLSAAETAIQGADMVSQIAWEDAQEFRRTSPLVSDIAQQIGLSESELDDLFIQAAQIEA